MDQDQKDFASKETILKEQFWFTATMIGFDAFIIKSILGTINIGFILIGGLILNGFAIYLIHDRANGYKKLNAPKAIPTEQDPPQKKEGFIKRNSGEIFYIMLIAFSFIGILARYFNSSNCWWE